MCCNCFRILFLMQLNSKYENGKGGEAGRGGGKKEWERGGGEAR